MTTITHDNENSWANKQIESLKKKYIEDAEKLMYTAAEGSTLDKIWKGEYMAKTNKKGFDVPKGFPIPLNQSVILEKIHEENITKAGLILQEDSSDNNVARIMAVAEDCNPKLQPGLKVMYNIHEDRTIRFEENNYLIMHQLSVFCILPEKATLLPMPENKKEKKTQEYIRNEEKRMASQQKREQNKLDKIMETKKKLKRKL